MTARIRTNAVTARTTLAVRALRALAHDLTIEVKAHNRPSPVRGKLKAVANRHPMVVEEQEGGSTLVMCFTDGVEVPVEHAISIERVRG